MMCARSWHPAEMTPFAATLSMISSVIVWKDGLEQRAHKKTIAAECHIRTLRQCVLRQRNASTPTEALFVCICLLAKKFLNNNKFLGTSTATFASTSFLTFEIETPTVEVGSTSAASETLKHTNFTFEIRTRSSDAQIVKLVKTKIAKTFMRSFDCCSDFHSRDIFDRNPRWDSFVDTHKQFHSASIRSRVKFQ